MPKLTSVSTAALIVDSTASVEFACRVLDPGKLVLFHGGANLHEYGGQIVARVTADAEVELSVSDFDRDGRRFLAHCFSVSDHGGLIPWRRTDERSALVLSPGGADIVRFIVIAVRDDGQETYVDDYPIAQVDRMGGTGQL